MWGSRQCYVRPIRNLFNIKSYDYRPNFRQRRFIHFIFFLRMFSPYSINLMLDSYKMDLIDIEFLLPLDIYLSAFVCACLCLMYVYVTITMCWNVFPRKNHTRTMNEERFHFMKFYDEFIGIWMLWFVNMRILLVNGIEFCGLVLNLYFHRNKNYSFYCGIAVLMTRMGFDLSTAYKYFTIYSETNWSMGKYCTIKCLFCYEQNSSPVTPLRIFFL